MHCKSSSLRSVFGVTEILSDQSTAIRALLAEFVATTLLLTVGMGSGLPDKSGFVPNLFQSAIGGGLTVIAAVQISIHVSGAHLNPAITVAFLVTGRIKLLKAVLYIGAQVVAGITAAALLKALLPQDVIADNLIAKPGKGLENSQVFGIELIATMVLTFAVCTLADKRIAPVRGVEPLLLGLVVISLQLFSLKFSGCGLNPARILGPALITRGVNWNQVGIYCAAEICGGLTASIFYFAVLYERPSPPRVTGRGRLHSVREEMKVIPHHP